MTLLQQVKLQSILTIAHNDYEKGLNARAFFKVSNYEKGQDLVQQTFLKAWIYLVKGGKIETMKAFLYHILNNLIIDEYRKRKCVSLDVLLGKGFDPSIDDSSQMVDVFDGRSAFLLIRLLPFKYRKIMHMRYVKGLTLKEISIITGISKNNISVQLYRGLKVLKSLYKTN